MSLVHGFSRGSPVSPPFHSGTDPYTYQSSSSALKTSMLRAVQISSLITSAHRPGACFGGIILVYQLTSWGELRLARGYYGLWGRSGVMVRLLASHLGEPRSIPGGVARGSSHAGIVQGNVAGRRVFSGISRFPTLAFLRCSILTSLHPHQLSTRLVERLGVGGDVSPQFLSHTCWPREVAATSRLFESIPAPTPVRHRPSLPLAPFPTPRTVHATCHAAVLFAGRRSFSTLESSASASHEFPRGGLVVHTLLVVHQLTLLSGDVVTSTRMEEPGAHCAVRRNTTSLQQPRNSTQGGTSPVTLRLSLG
ncbi:hypothetical protein PR048_032934 [Dryococelus australis]|uniref:Uncharacterized protein n=1 Tax=Dryococelus australis TaxID=614101 RepID=A0ABQ9G6J8_9NEOP|nr:hypothetical protein PR048_032934 [Dryococelus australis]